MEMEMKELRKQRDNAQLALEELQKKMGDNQPVRIYAPSFSTSYLYC
jgi:hypothetical protein